LPFLRDLSVLIIVQVIFFWHPYFVLHEKKNVLGSVNSHTDFIIYQTYEKKLQRVVLPEYS
jgi:hypothetical protein